MALYCHITFTDGNFAKLENFCKNSDQRGKEDIVLKGTTTHTRRKCDVQHELFSQSCMTSLSRDFVVLPFQKPERKMCCSLQFVLLLELRYLEMKRNDISI